MKKSAFLDSLYTVAVLAAAMLLAELLAFWGAAAESAAVLYMLAVIIVSRITAGYVYGAISAGFCALGYDFLVCEPRMGFGFTAEFFIVLAALLLAAGITGALTGRLRTQARLSAEREHRANLLFEINQKLLASGDRDAILRLTCAYLVEQLHRPAAVYSAPPGAAAAVIVSPDGEGYAGLFDLSEEKALVLSLFEEKEDKFFSDMSENGVFYRRIHSKRSIMAVAGVLCADAPMTDEELSFVDFLFGQVALALEVQHIAEMQRRTMVESAREKMRGTLLHAISHDLRTPLTGILGASTAILDQKELPIQTVRELSADIRDNAQWLIRLVENILTVTRISREDMKVAKAPEAAEEVVSQAIAIVRRRYLTANIQAHIPHELLIVPMDGTLICQVLINLLENAVKNSEEGRLIEVRLKKQGDGARFDVADNGRGLSARFLETLFSPDSAEEALIMDASRGVGIGLSICKTIVTAHGGEIRGQNREEGGAVFTFVLPLGNDHGK